MRQGRPRSMRMNALLALVAGAATVHSKHDPTSSKNQPATPVAVYTTTRLAREHKGQYQVPNKTKRGLRRRQTRRR